MAMTKDELDMVHSYMDASHSYLEFGSGESTIYAANASMIKNIDSVESSEKYITENLKPNIAIANALASGKLRFHIVDIGETIDWGYPKNQSKKHLWPNYSLSVFSRQSNHDLVLVDGRFRVACALNSALNTSEDCSIIIHDFWSRPEYHILLKYLKVKNRVDTVCVFGKKRDCDFRKAQALIRKYQYLPSDGTLFDEMKEKLKKCLLP